ncbi:MAG TPA: methyltransferase domain-containing protein [Solirubrobacter sp.]|nr:methyltransferase domain-containing protein [Solirubrobacter sp.]
MTCCCNPRGCDELFNPRYARRMAQRYRTHGLDRSSSRMVAYLERHEQLDGATVLEIGGGVGALQLELLKRGAARTTNLELSPAYDDQAYELAREAGLEDRVSRRIHDIAVAPDEVEPADIVVLHRVVCCYPDYEKLLGAAATRARRALVFSHPPCNPVSRALLGAQNLIFKALGREFRAFAHPPRAMRAVLERHGLQPAFRHRGLPWQFEGRRRSAAPDPSTAASSTA